MKRWMTVTATLAMAFGLLAQSAGAAQGTFGFESVGTWLRTTAGAPELQAGAHPDFNTTFQLNTTTNEEGKPTAVAVNPKDVKVTLPAGLVGNPQAAPTCSPQQFYELVNRANCPPQSQVGEATVTFYYGRPLEFTEPIYNLTPPRGVAAQFAFDTLGVPTFIDAGVSAEGGYHLVAESRETSQGINIGGASITLWGTPGSHAYDMVRSPQGGVGNEGLPVLGASLATPFISSPTSCPGSPLTTSFSADSWRAPTVLSEASTSTDPEGAPLVIGGCERVPFSASMTARPTTTEAEAPTGLDVKVEFPQTEPEGLRASDLRDAVVTLPEGMTVNPSSAGGLSTCTVEEIGLGDSVAPSCPKGSELGTLKVSTPLLAEGLTGSVYLAQQGKNKFGSLLALYLTIENAARGVLVKLPGKVEPDPTTGRLVVRFEDTPQLPISTLEMELFSGPRAALMTPPACGTYSTAGSFTPWSGNAPVVASDSFRITSGPQGGPCPTAGFTPKLEAGTADPAAGQYSPLELRVSRPDGSQRLGSVGVTLPKGMLANLSGIPYCSDATLASIPTALGTGAGQLASPSCPAASRVGSVSVAAGPGSTPFWVKSGSVYLAGPYKGAPLSLGIVTPALAGPFDLGNVVVRAALRVDPETAIVTAQSDPLPTILQGIPLDLRELRVTLDRQDFTLNPTSCAQAGFAATIASSGGAVATPSVPYAASSCAGLGFSPQLTLELKGGTHRGAFPALTATVKAKRGQANIGRVAVALPRSEFLEQGHIGTVCTRVQFAAGACPQGSIYGYAEAVSPLLSQPLAGPVYLRSSSHKLPDLVAALAGQIDIDLDGRIDSVRGGIRTTFESVPDAPISSFTLRMRGGKKSLLVNSTDICVGKHRAQVRMVGQNGGRAASSPPVAAASCKPAPKARHRG